jgi:hypothetical protein
VATRGCGKGSCGSKNPLNLDSLGDNKVPDNDEISAENQQAEFTKLRSWIMSCQRCGKHVYCKVNKYRIHITLKTGQVISLAHAIVCKFHCILL